MKVVVLTTSYPRGPDDVAGVFVRDAVEHLREAGLIVAVVSPASFRHYGLAYGDGIVGNIRRRPWKAVLVPLFLVSYARAARDAARDADVVHAQPQPRVALGSVERGAVEAPGQLVEDRGRSGHGGSLTRLAVGKRLSGRCRLSSAIR